MNNVKIIGSNINLLKLLSGLILISLIVWSVKSHAQEEVSFSVIMPEEYIEKRDLSKLDKSINIPVKTSFYSKDEELDFANYEETTDVIIARNYLVEEAIYEEKMAELDNSLITNIGYINPHFLKSNYDDGRKYSVPLTWGGIGILYRKDKFDNPPATWRWLLDSDKYSGRVALINDGRTLI